MFWVHKKIKKRILIKENKRKYGQLTCELCLKQIKSNKEATIDHKIPKRFKGSWNLKNLQLAHQKCNLKKGSVIWL